MDRVTVGALHMSGQALTPRQLVRPAGYALLAAAGLLAFYLGTITLAQGWPHAVEQLAEDRWFVGAITAGFGTQMGLFTYMRGLHTGMAGVGMGASTGTSTAAMLACCAHHLTEIFAFIGLSGLAVFLNVYKTPLLWVGIIMNAGGILYMLREISRQQRMMRSMGITGAAPTSHEHGHGQAEGEAHGDAVSRLPPAGRSGERPDLDLAGRDLLSAL